MADFVGGQLQTTLAVLAPSGRHVSTVDNTVEQHGGQWIWVRPEGSKLGELATLATRGVLALDVPRQLRWRKSGPRSTRAVAVTLVASLWSFLSISSRVRNSSESHRHVRPDQRAFNSPRRDNPVATVTLAPWVLRGRCRDMDHSHCEKASGES